MAFIPKSYGKNKPIIYIGYSVAEVQRMNYRNLRDKLFKFALECLKWSRGRLEGGSVSGAERALIFKVVSYP